MRSPPPSSLLQLLPPSPSSSGLHGAARRGVAPCHTGLALPRDPRRCHWMLQKDIFWSRLSSCGRPHMALVASPTHTHDVLFSWSSALNSQTRQTSHKYFFYNITNCFESYFHQTFPLFIVPYWLALVSNSPSLPICLFLHTFFHMHNFLHLLSRILRPTAQTGHRTQKLGSSD